MSVSISYRSIDPMHPAMAFKIAQRVEAQRVEAQRVEAMTASFETVAQEVPEFQHQKDGRLVGSYEVCFDNDFGDSDVGNGDLTELSEHPLFELLQLCRLLSEEFEVNWEFSHDYEIDPVGKIIDGVLDDCLIEEIESIIQIGNLFGDIAVDDEFEEEEAWEPRETQFGSWRQNIQISAATVQDDDGPHVLKFPGVE